MDKKCEDFCAENSISLTKSTKYVYFAYKILASKGIIIPFSVPEAQLFQ